MKCIQCGLENPDITSALHTSDHSGGHRNAGGECSRVLKCVSCGRPMDFTVYFTVCPHCGFNYRIQVSPIRSDEGVPLKRVLWMMLLMISALVLLFSIVYVALL